MDQLNSPLLKEQNKIIAENCSSAYLESSRYRRWELSYGGKDKFYLTTSERNAFLKAINGGATVVQIGNMTLSGLFRYLVSVKNEERETESWGIPSLEIISEDQRAKNCIKIKEMKKKLRFGRTNYAKPNKC